MEPESFLLTTAELSLGVVGFSAVVAALVRGRRTEESDYQALLIVAMVEFGFAALLFALLPLIIGFFGVGSIWTSRLSNTALAAFYFSYFPMYQRRRAAALEHEAPRGSERNFYIRLAVSYSVAALALAAGWGLVPLPMFAVYAVGIAWLLFLAALGFLITIRQARG